MKRRTDTILAAGLLSACLLLSSCSLFGSQVTLASDPPPRITVPADPDPPFTIHPPETEDPAVIEPAATEEASPPEITAEPEIPVMTEIAEQYYEEPQYKFLSQPDYGTILPYAGGKGLFGFACADGRIICEPIFNDLKLYAEPETEEGQVFVYTAVVSELVLEPESVNEFLKSAVIASDGSFYYEYNDAHKDDDRFLLHVLSGDEWSFIDYKGNPAPEDTPSQDEDLYLEWSFNVNTEVNDGFSNFPIINSLKDGTTLVCVCPIQISIMVSLPYCELRAEDGTVLVRRILPNY